MFLIKQTKMKKILFICLLTAISAACSNMEKTAPGGDESELSVSSSVTKVKPNTAIKYTVAASSAVFYDVEITVKSNAPEIASVNPSTLILSAGDREIEGNVTALSDGKAVITISSSDLHVKSGSFTLTVDSNIDVPTEFELSIVVENESFNVGDKVPFIIESPVEAPEDIEVTILATPESAVSVPAKLIMLKGEKSVASEMEMLEAGSAAVVISSSGHKINVGKVDINIVDNDAQ